MDLHPGGKLFLFPKKNFLGEIWPLKVLVLTCLHTTLQNQHTNTNSSTHTHHGPRTCPHMSGKRAGRPPGSKKTKRGGFQTRTAGQFGGKKTAAPPSPAAPPDLDIEHDSETPYHGDEEDISSGGEHSQDSECSSGSEGDVTYDGTSGRQQRRLRKRRRDKENKRGRRTLFDMWPSLRPSASTPGTALPVEQGEAGEVKDNALVFAIVGGDDGDEMAGWFGGEDMQDVDFRRCVDSSSESEGLLFGGYNGDSGDCTSSEESVMEWSDSGGMTQPVEGAPEDPQGEISPVPSPELLLDPAARRSRRILPTATAAAKPPLARPKGGDAGTGRGNKLKGTGRGTRRKDKRNRAQVKLDRRNRRAAKRRAASDSARLAAQQEREKIFVEAREILGPVSKQQ